MVKVYCKKCGRELKGERCYKVTAGKLMAGPDWDPPFFNPSEAPYYLCENCMKGDD